MTQERINLEIDPDLKAKAVKAASDEDRSLSQFIRRLIRDAVEKVEFAAPATTSAADKETSQHSVAANG